MRLACLALVLAACAQNQAAADLYNQAESGSTWKLTFTDVPEGCPVIASLTAHLPDGAVASCGSGCACLFSLELDDNGEQLGADYSVHGDYEQECADGSSLDCFDADPEDGLPGLCYGVGVCQYNFVIAEVDAEN